MTTIDRSSFDAHTLDALDDVARLLHIFQAVLGMKETFKNAGHRGLSASEAKPAAKKILKASKAAAAGLMEAVFDRGPEKTELGRKRYLTRLTRALEHASELARQEREAIPDIGERVSSGSTWSCRSGRSLRRGPSERAESHAVRAATLKQWADYPGCSGPAVPLRSALIEDSANAPVNL